MPDPIKIQITADADGAITGIKMVNDSLGSMNQSAQKASEGGLGSLVKGAADAYSSFQMLSGALTQGAGMIDSMNSLGVSSIRATEALNSLSGGKADSYISTMSSATHGLVDNMTLAKDATLALGTGVARSSDDLAKIAEIGATLGTVFEGSATQGISDFTRVLETVGNTRGLKQLGIDANAVKAEFERLKAAGMDVQLAWEIAVEDISGKQANKLKGALDGTGTALEKLKTQITDIISLGAEHVAIGVEATLTLVGAGWDFVLGQYEKNSVGDIFQAALKSGKLSSGSGASVQESGPLGVGQSYDNGKIVGGEGWQPIPIVNAPYASAPTPYNSSSWAYGADNTATDREKTSYGGDQAGVDKMSAAAIAAKANLDALFHDANMVAQPFLNTVKAINAEMNTPSKAYTFQQSFGTTSNQITQTYGSDMSGAIAQERANLAARDKAKGMNQKQIAADLANYDQNAQQQIDQYNLATGQATTKSLAFRDTQAQLTQAFESGKLSLAEYTNGMLALANAAQDANSSASTLALFGAETKSINTGVAMTSGDVHAVQEHAGDTKQVDPFHQLTDSANKLAQAAQVAGDHVGGAIGIINTMKVHNPMTSAIDGFSTATSLASNYASVLGRLPSMVAADVQIHIQGTVSNGGGGSGSNGKIPRPGHPAQTAN